jgi:formylglycine-generating enzyme required for sulfatase activity
MITGQLPFKGEHEQAVIHSILNREPVPVNALRAGVAVELERLVMKALTRNPLERYQQADEMRSDLSRGPEHDSMVTRERPSGSRPSPAKRRSRYLGLIAVLALLSAGMVFFLLRSRETHRVNALVAELEAAAAVDRLDDVFQQLQASGLDLNDSTLNGLAQRLAGTLVIDSEPSGAAVTVTRAQPIATFAARKPLALGRTPLAGSRLIAGEYFVRLTLEATNSLEFLVSLEPARELRLRRNLLPAGADTEGMVAVEAGNSPLDPKGVRVPTFLIDRSEVTNEQFSKFVAAGGYRDPQLWPAALIVAGRATPWASAVHAFVDRTGVPGPRVWSGGTYPADQRDHPVTGVSWYEASAYARWAGKELPTGSQWWRAALDDAVDPFPWGRDARSAEQRANFELGGTRPVGSYRLGVSRFGCVDMAGNVREWLRDTGPDPSRRVVVGGSWQDPVYMFEPDRETAEGLCCRGDDFLRLRGKSAETARRRVAGQTRRRSDLRDTIAGGADRRLAAVIILNGGHFDALEREHLPAACPANYIGRISPRPLLMLHGKYDTDHVPETSVEPLYRLAKSPKQILWSESGHAFPSEDNQARPCSRGCARN